MANPKYKTPRSKTRKRRSHLQLDNPNAVPCPHCKALKLPHHVCRACGRYNGREIFKLEAQ